MATGGNTNSLGRLVPVPGTALAELTNVCSTILSASTTNIAMETLRVWANGVPAADTVMETDSVVVIVDTTDPVITTCPPDVTIDFNDSTDPADTGEAVAEDDCFEVTITYDDSEITECPSSFTRTWTVYR